MDTNAQNTQYAIHNTLHEINSTNSYVRIYKLFMQNKANFRDDKMNINTTLTMNYVILSHWLRRKNKPNSNPIKPKTNPIKANTNPIKANTNPIQTQSKPILCQFIPESHNLGLQQGTYIPEGCVER